MIVFFDTSALVKLYHEEKGSDALTKFISEHHGALASIVSDVARIEVRSALWKKVRMRDANAEKTKDALTMFGKHLHRFQSIKLSEQVHKIAAELIDKVAPTSPLRTLDAIQLSTALVVNESRHIDKFICSDKNLIRVATEYFSVFDPEAGIV